MTENIQVFTQNSIRIESSLGAIYVDPFQMKESPKDAAFIMITHEHYDHFSPDDIQKVAGENTTLVVPKKMEKKAKEIEGLFKKTVTVEPDGSYELDGLVFETVPADNLLKPVHPKSAGWVGYVFDVDGQRIYVAGDIDAIKEAKAVKCDVALVPIGGFYTMDAGQAAGLINEMQPSVAIPVHYGKLVGKPEDGKTFADMVKEPIQVEFKIQF